MSTTSTDGSPVLRMESVRKTFGGSVVLRDVDLEVAPHTVTALIGASGSGKSTLLRCLNRLEHVQEGEIIVDGQRLTDHNIDVNALRKKIGIVFQAFNLFPHMTVLQNVMLAPRKATGASRDEAEARARALLKRIGLEEKAEEFPDRLSGGQQQRVAIVRALAMEPKLMLLDEITSALDPQLVTDVLSLVRELAESGMTMIVATHEMGFAREVADKVCFLDNGIILEEAPPDQMFTSPREPRTREFLARVLEAERLA
jgi:polar amino acid transport system ATP-binding protein